MFPLNPSLRSFQEEVLQPFVTKTLNQKLSVTHNLTGYNCSLARKPLAVRELTSISQLNSEPRLEGKRASVLTHSARLANSAVEWRGQSHHDGTTSTGVGSHS